MSYSPIINDYSEEKNIDRATSWFEFVLYPNSLDAHLDALLSGNVSNPTGPELIKLFLKQTQSSDAKRAHLLRQFCAKIAVKLNISLDGIESHIPLKYQKQLLLEMQAFDQSIIYSLNYHRWILRSAIKRSQLVVDQDIGNDSGSIDPFSNSITPSAIRKSIDSLQQWLDSKNFESESPETGCYGCQTSFELGNYFFVTSEETRSIGHVVVPGTHQQARAEFERSRKILNILVNSKVEESVIRKYSSVNMTTVEAFISACTPQKEIPEDQLTLMERIESLKQSGNHEQILSTLIADGSATLPLQKQIPWLCRKELEKDVTFDHSIRTKIFWCNLIKKAIIGEAIHYPSYLSQKRHEELKEELTFLFETCEQMRQDYPSTDIPSKLRQFLQSMCFTFNRSFLWKMFSDLGKSFLAGNDKEMILFSSEKDNESTITFKRRKIIDTEPSATSLSQSQQAFIDLKKAQHALQMGQIEHAKNVLNAISFQEQESGIRQALEYIKLAADIKEQESAGTFEYNKQYIDRAFSLLEISLPPFDDILESILAYFLNQSFLEETSEYMTRLKQKVTSQNLEDPVSLYMVSLAELAAELGVLLQSCRKYQTIIQMDEQREFGKSIESVFNRVLRLLVGRTELPSLEKTKPTLLKIDWNANTGLLSKLGKPEHFELLDSFVAFVAGALFHIRKSKKSNSLADPYIDRYGILAQLAGGSSFFAKSSIVSVQYEPAIMELFHQTLLRLHKLTPEFPTWLYGLGDYYLDSKYEGEPEDLQRDFIRSRESIKYYLWAGAIQTSFFTSHSKVPKPFYMIIKRLIPALCTVKEYCPAIVLCQFLPTVDFNLAFKIAQEHAPHLDPTYLQYIWELPLLELLISIYTKGRDEKKLTLLSHIITSPELNQHNPTEIRESFVQSTKMLFLKALRQDFI